MAANTDVTMATTHFFSRDVQSLSLVINLQSRVKNLHMAAKHGLSLARQGNLLHSISFDSSLEIKKTLISVQCICKNSAVIFIKTLALCHSKNWFFNIFQHTKFLIIMSVCLSVHLSSPWLLWAAYIWEESCHWPKSRSCPWSVVTDQGKGHISSV